jgi:hypothetical protein
LNVEVRTSKIHGTGVFATRDLKKGEMVLTIDDSDPVLDRSRLTPEEIIHLDVFIGKDGKEKVTFMKSPEKYINSSCDPNVHSRTDMKSGVRSAYALKHIRRGEELSWDYAVNSWEEWENYAECMCGSPNCRKMIRGSFFLLPRDVQLRYIPVLDLPFRRHFAKEIAPIES